MHVKLEEKIIFLLIIYKMTLKDLLWSKPVKYSVIGVGATVAAIIGTKLLYDYSMYSNLKYVKKQLDNINLDEI